MRHWKRFFNSFIIFWYIFFGLSCVITLYFYSSKELSQSAWDVFEMSQSYLHSDFSKTSQKRSLWCDVFKISQIYLKNGVFFVTYLRRLKYLSKMMFFMCRLSDVPEVSQKICLFCDSDTSQKYLLIVFVTIQKYPTKMVLRWWSRCGTVKNTQEIKRRFLGAIRSH